MTVMFDISRLIARQGYATATGIDRFELNYARWLRDSALAPIFVETGMATPAALRTESAHALIERVSQRWARLTTTPEDVRQLEAIVAAIDGKQPWKAAAATSARPSHPISEVLARGTGRAFRKLTAPWSAAPDEMPFIHVSHARLDRPGAFGWLGARRRRGVFYVHDLIPLSHPEFVRVGEPERHMRRITTVLRHASLVLCNSQATATALDRLAQQHGLLQPRSAILPPGVDDAFAERPSQPAVATRRPYFVCVGTIEPRKNHALLLQLWRRLLERHGEAAPRLVIVGRRGWDNAELFKILDLPYLLEGSVIEVADLADAALAPLLAGAAALLAPSFMEGYGMPVVEAMTIGTPVIASNISSHREVTRGGATLLDPLNGRDWLSAIEAHASLRRRCKAGPAWRWADHFRAVERLIVSERQEIGCHASTPGRAGPGPGVAVLARWSAG